MENIDVDVRVKRVKLEGKHVTSKIVKLAIKKTDSSAEECYFDEKHVPFQQISR